MENNQKLFNQGFTIIRKDETRLTIKKLTRAKSLESISAITNEPLLGLSWQDFEKGFCSKSALHRRYQELLIDDKIISG